MKREWRPNRFLPFSSVMTPRKRVTACLALLLWLSAVHIVGLILFVRGFFLTRFEVSERSSCVQHPFPVHSQDPQPTCWHPPVFRRAVLLLVDALRYDFAAPWDSPDDVVPFYANRLRVVDRLLHEQPEQTMLFKFHADPPTTTMQRLKGLTTGSLPTFMDVGRNFDSPVVGDDNWVHQLAQEGHKRVVFLGDDTWMGMFPHHFHRSYPFPSFNVKDIHTVDEGVIQHLLPEIVAGKEQGREGGTEGDWDVLIGHFLGVDHIGHTYGSNVPVMAEKLTQINDVLEQVVATMDDDTLLMVFGDHGMTEDGNHGGASEEETEAALLIYSHHLHLTREHSLPESVDQVDLAPTLCLALGVPIPFNSLGMVIPEVLMSKDVSSQTQSAQKIADALHINAWQVHSYLTTYAERVPSFPAHQVQSLAKLRTNADAEYTSHNASAPLMAAEGYKRYLRSALELCRAEWTTFDVTLMTWGTVVAVVGLVVTILALLSPVSIPCEHLVAGAGIGGIASFSVSFYDPPILAMAALGSCLVFVIRSFKHIDFRWILSVEDSGPIPFCVLLVLYSATHFSNSFVVAENHVLLFLSASALILLGRRSLAKGDTGSWIRIILSLLALRASSLCAVSLHDLNTPASIWSLGSLLVLLLLLGGIERLHQVRSPTFRILTALSFLSVSTLWLHPTLSSDVRILLPRLTYGCCLVAWAWVLLSANEKTSTLLLLESLIPVLVLLLGVHSPLVLGCIGIAAWPAVQDANHRFLSQSSPVWWQRVPSLVTSCLLMNHTFFVTGHTCTFSSLHIASAFVGLREFNFLFSGILLFLDTFACCFLLALALPLLIHESTIDPTPYIFVILFSSTHATMSTIGVSILRRHLMVWAVFAPKFVFDVLMLVTVDTLVVLSYWVLSINKGLGRKRQEP